MTRTRARVAAVTAVVPVLLYAAAAAVVDCGPLGGDPAAGHVPSTHSADAGFARDMAVHHQQAVEISFVVRDRTRDPEVRLLAYDIANTQANQRGMLLGWLDLWGLAKVDTVAEPMDWAKHFGRGHTPHAEHRHRAGGEIRADGPTHGMATAAELETLADASGRQAETLFLRLMTDHHRGGVEMAQACAELCTVPATRSLADKMAASQGAELETMADMLGRRGASPGT